LAGDELEALGDAGRLHVLDAGVEVLDVLADQHQVNAAAAVGRRHVGQLAHRADVGVGLEEFAQGDVSALLAVADGGGERALEDDAGLADGFDGVGGDAGGDAAQEGGAAGDALLPLDLGAAGLDDAPGGADGLGADAVAGDQGDQFLARGRDEHVHGGGLRIGGATGRLRVSVARGPAANSAGRYRIPGRAAPSARAPGDEPYEDDDYYLRQEVRRSARRRTGGHPGGGFARLGWPLLGALAFLAAPAFLGCAAWFALTLSRQSGRAALAALAAFIVVPLGEYLLVGLLPVRLHKVENGLSRAFLPLTFLLLVGFAGVLWLFLSGVRTIQVHGDEMAPAVPSGERVLISYRVWSRDLVRGRVIAF